MILAAAGARRRNSSAQPRPEPAQQNPPGTLTAPYNAAARQTWPTPDATGASLHPSVVDMGPSGWNGWRYWATHTPYYNKNTQLENPCIVVSADGLTWQEPTGITNPIDPWPGRGYNSDVELVYDPDGDRMVCYWRDYLGGSGVPGNLVFCASESTDGVTWTPQQNLISMTFPDTGGVFSPAVLHVAPGEWMAWFIDDNGPCHAYTAPGPLGPWTGPTALTFGGTMNGGVSGLWHGDVVRTDDGVYRYIINAPYVSSGSGSNLYAASSLDGIAWSAWSSPVIQYRAGEWDARIYRATLLPYGDLMRCWYSAYGADNQPGIGHSWLPLSLWPAPPT